MADRRRGKQRRREGEPEKPTKEEYAVAKHLRFNLPTREGKLVGMTVQYFIASKAVDMLLESKWGVSAKSASLFTTRSGCADYCNNLLNKGIFHRAARIGKRKDRDAVKKKKKVKESEEESKELTKDEEKKSKALEKRNKKKEKKKEKEEDEETEKDKEKESDGEKDEKKGEKKEEEKKIPDEERRKKKKVKLEMHDHQVFKDGDEFYVWIYDPVPFKTFVIGLLLVLGAIAVCMFPLWPPEVRLGIYYLSLACAGFVGIILALCVIRLVLFCLVWGLTFGRHHFWFLPNLTEDVGFFDSFRPLYKHDSFDQSKQVEPPKDEQSTDQMGKEGQVESKDTDMGGEKEEKGSDKEGSVEGSEDNGYEIVDREEFLQKEGEEDEDEGEGSDQGEDEEEECEEGDVESKKDK